MAINWQLFPRYLIAPQHLVELVAAFETVQAAIASPTQQLSSNVVMEVVRPELEKLNYDVETKGHRVDRPVLFGKGGRAERSFRVDAFHEPTGTVVEVEAGRAVINYQFLKDLFEACAIQDARYLVIAVMNEYRPASAKVSAQDFATVTSFLDTLYSSGRLELPLDGVLIIGY